MKIVYHIDAPTDAGSLTVQDQIRWAANEAEAQGQKMLTEMRKTAEADGATVELVETYVLVDTHDIGMFAISAPRARLAVVLRVMDLPPS